MEAKDLRLGNYVQFVNEPFIVVINTLKAIKNDSDLFQPIPLTEEWLLKFGFEKINHIRGYSFYSLSKSKKNRCHIDVYNNQTKYMGYCVNHCEYVHQLQNLYFALTGIELIIK